MDTGPFRNASAKGAWAEALVIADLLARGFEVYTAVSPSADCDLVALVDGICLRVEVRFARVNSSGGLSIAPREGQWDVLAVVTGDGTVLYDSPLAGFPATCTRHGVTLISAI